MQIDVVQAVQVGLQIIGVATLLLNFVAPLSKNQTDDKVVAFLKKVLSAVALNVKDEENPVLTIKLPKK